MKVGLYLEVGKLVPFTLSKPKFNDKKKVQVQGRFLARSHCPRWECIGE